MQKSGYHQVALYPINTKPKQKANIREPKMESNILVSKSGDVSLIFILASKTGIQMSVHALIFCTITEILFHQFSYNHNTRKGFTKKS